MHLLDLTSAIFWLGVSIFAFLEARELGIGTLQVPGPGFAILLGGLILGTFSILLILSALLGEKQLLPGTEQSGQPKGRGRLRVVLVFCALLAYIALLPKIGFLILTFVLITFMYHLLERGNPWLDVAAGLCTVVLAYLVFSVWLQIPLPRGMFGI